ncbi:transglutaminase-like domain-containing protein [Baaleninema simplex]|uniref:transglutaminase-like domain-containing protein n=2 Tax=Baaleninema simplex TaxID=2862350 RepID=UPI000349F689|nr:transglutaminase family protein [Baaleninema simplex]
MTTNPWLKTLRPHGVYALHGLTATDNTLVAVDSVRGYLVSLDPKTDDTRVLNPHNAGDFVGAAGLCLWEETLWFSRGDTVYYCTLDDFTPQRFVTLPYAVQGIAVYGPAVYVTCQKESYIYVFSRETKREITRFYAPGVGVENLCVRGEELWVSDTIEQTVYCMDRGTGSILFSLLTPFPSPTALTFYNHPELEESVLYVAYAMEEPYIRDDPNSANPYQLTFRDRTFVHPLHVYHNPDKHYTLSNGYLIEMSYVEELSPLDPVELEALEWHIALPVETPRQSVRHLEPVGLPFETRVIDEQPIAVFQFDRLKPHEARIFGWRAILEVRGIKYHFKPRDVDDLPEMPPEYQQRYLVDNDNLAMDTETVQRAARNAIGTETNLLRQVLNIRDYVYDRLEYGIKPHIDTPDIVLKRGMGSCGEYVGILLALLRLNGIACRTVGRYKCPDRAESREVALQPDFNHVWLEFLIPGYGWIPMESNPDDMHDRGPHPLRFFMGLAWYHIELVKGVKFESLVRDGKRIPKEEVSLGDLAINHVRFRILEELPPKR